MSARGNVLVTGAARRIGRAIALGLSRRGWNVAVHYEKSGAEALQVVKEIEKTGARAVAVRANLLDVDETRGLIRQCCDALGEMTALVNNAAVFEFDRGATCDTQVWARHLDVNLRAPLILAQEMQRCLPENRTGCVVNLLDQKVFNLNPDFFSYTVSKIALEGMTRVLAIEFAPRLRVCAVAPGLTLASGDQTPENFEKAHTVTPLRRSSTTEDIVGAIAYVLDAPAFTGSTLIVDGGQHLLPLNRDVMYEVK